MGKLTRAAPPSSSPTGFHHHPGKHDPRGRKRRDRESGSHQQLLDRAGRHAHFYRLRFSQGALGGVLTRYRSCPDDAECGPDRPTPAHRA